jgi:TatD DNase family protein
MIDTHAHLYDKQFSKDLDVVIDTAIEAGVEQFLLPNIDTNTIEPMFRICKLYPKRCFPMLGLHPTAVDKNFEKHLKTIEGYLSDTTIVGIGEIGIDLHWDKQYLAQQIEAFRIQIGWAKKLKLPLSIHCRKSYNELISILKKEQDGTLTGVFHCFPGNVQQALQVIELGFMIGIGGVVTYKNAEMATVAQQIDPKYILVETDAPYLHPEPTRRRRNESAEIKTIIQKIAHLKSMPENELAAITVANTQRVFGGVRMRNC